MNILKDYNPDFSQLKLLAKNYHALGYTPLFKEMMGRVYPDCDFSGIEKYELHRLISETLINYRFGEQRLKYYLFRHFWRQNVIAAFEIKVGSSRADFLTINGSTRSFEIKSSLDNLYKLPKQTSDYLSVFDYNYVVIDTCHLEAALEIIPPGFGIWSFSAERKKMHRKALLNQNKNPSRQLSLLTKKEVKEFFQEESASTLRMVRYYGEAVINERFKLALKNRYKKRWNFIVEHKQEILPVDLQFFFNTNVKPAIIYA